MLTKDVENVGHAGEIKDVADGYGRNFLIPRKLAVLAGRGVEAEAKRIQDAAARREAKDRDQARELAEEIDNKTVVVRLKVGAEDKVFGAITNEDISTAITRVLAFLHPEDFYRENNGHVYRAAQNLFREGEPIDNVTLAAELEKLGVLERVGGRAQLALLQESVPTAANVEYYARIVKDRAYKRRLITSGANVTALGYEESLDADEAVNKAQSEIYAISDDRVGGAMERPYDLLKPAMDR